MGITASQQSEPDEKPKEETLAFNQISILVQSRLLIMDVLKELRAEGEDTAIFADQMKKNLPGVKRGENFQGRVDEKGELYGIAKVFSRNGNTCTIYFGEISKGVPIGRAINIKAELLPNTSLKQYQLDRENYEVFLLEDQIKNGSLQNIKRGCFLKKHKDKERASINFFKGEFLNQQFHVGRLKVKQNDHIKMIYEGEFRNNGIHGRGILLIPGKYKYEGQFENQAKTGIGKEYDEIRKTYYIGEFEADKRHGYGELTYMNRDNVKLKGFWTDGIMRSGEGMYVNKEGIFLETLGDDINLL